MSRLLRLMGLAVSQQSADYVSNKSQFHLYTLVTEQRHPKTRTLSFTIQSDVQAGLGMLLSVDDDVSVRISELIRGPKLLEQAVQAVCRAILSRRRIFVYGCGATGRLAKQMESTFWRPFWRSLKRSPHWARLRQRLPADIEDRLTGEMTGADRALVSSLEGFEDLQLIGRLQLEHHGIKPDDVVFAVTEGGETSSVIGAILAALELYGGDVQRARECLYFVYNNPDDVLRPFQRSASVIDSPGITALNLTTGPQAITGSTRLQATTIETFVIGAVLEEAVFRLIRPDLEESELRALGWDPESTLAGRLASFPRIKAGVDSAVPRLAALTRLEADTYRSGHFATYYADAALITVFIDNTERSPTFRLYPLDRVIDSERRCWTQVWTDASGGSEAWRKLLGRPFKGLSPEFYRESFETRVADPYLKQAALRSLAGAGDDQQFLYDFSFTAANVDRRGPGPGDLGVMVLLDEETGALGDPASAPFRFLDILRARRAKSAVVLARRRERPVPETIAELLGGADVLVDVILDISHDPITLRRQIALKMLLNAHSTGMMASLGRVIGNTMTGVSPSNLKLIGRATWLVMSHVNDVLRHPSRARGRAGIESVTFSEANVIIMDAIDYVQSQSIGQTAEVALSIIRTLETLANMRACTWDEAHRILQQEGLESYLLRRNPALKDGRGPALQG